MTDLPTAHSEFVDFFAELNDLETFVGKFRSLANHFLSLFKNLLDRRRTGFDFSHEVLGSGRQFTN